MAEMFDIRATTISDLPPEILSHIFTFLPHNLKVVRLVCSKWNESSNIEKVSGHEKITIDADRQSPEYVDGFFRTETLLRNIYNLSLWNVAIKTHHVSFFEKFGGQLRTLLLSMCTADEYVPFLQYCKNLNTLDVSDCDSPSIVHSFRYSDGSFLQTNIVSLTIGYCENWSDESMDACFRICPHFHSLSLQWIPREHSFLAENKVYSFEDGEEHVFNRSDILSFSCKYHAISVRAVNIVALELESLNGILPEQIEQIASIPNLRLRVLKIIDHDTITNRNIFNIVNLQSNLENVEISGCEDISSNGMADWIAKCTKLTHLTIHAFNNSEFVFDGKLLDALTSRLHLRELLLVTRDNSVVRSDVENCRGTFDQLRTLVLKLPSYDCVLGKVSVNLNELSLRRDDAISKKTFEFISSRFTSLKTLSLTISRSDLCEDDSIVRIPSWNFKKLKTLKMELPRFDQDSFSLASVLRRFEAPNLQSLELDGFHAIEADLLFYMVLNYPSMERFSQRCRSWPDNMDPSYLHIASGWKRLYSFNCDDTEYLHLHQRRGNEEKFYSAPALPTKQTEYDWNLELESFFMN